MAKSTKDKLEFALSNTAAIAGTLAVRAKRERLKTENDRLEFDESLKLMQKRLIEIGDLFFIYCQENPL